MYIYVYIYICISTYVYIYLHLCICDIINECESALQHTAKLCKCVALCCSVFWLAVRCRVLRWVLNCSVLQCVATCCSVLQYVAVCCSVLQCVAVLLCVAICCTVLQCLQKTYMKEFCHPCLLVIPPIWMSHVPHMNESCPVVVSSKEPHNKRLLCGTRPAT